MKTIKQIVEEEKITKVSELLEKHPEVWHQGSYFALLKNEDGSLINATPDTAYKACGAGCFRILHPEYEDAWVQAVWFLTQACNMLNFAAFNDRASNVQEVIDLLKEHNL